MRELYQCYLNGKPYGVGDLGYMKELFVDYFITCEMYGRDSADFKVEKIDRDEKMKRVMKNVVERNYEGLKRLED